MVKNLGGVHQFDKKQFWFGTLQMFNKIKLYAYRC